MSLTPRSPSRGAGGMRRAPRMKDRRGRACLRAARRVAPGIWHSRRLMSSESSAAATGPPSTSQRQPDRKGVTARPQAHLSDKNIAHEKGPGHVAGPLELLTAYAAHRSLSLWPVVVVVVQYLGQVVHRGGLGGPDSRRWEA